MNLIIILFLVASLFSSVSPKKLINLDSHDNYELRIALWKTRTRHADHWAIQVNKEGRRDARQFDIVNDPAKQGSWIQRNLQETLDSETLAGTIVVGKLPETQYLKILLYVRMQPILVRRGVYTNCQHYVAAFLDWCTKDAQGYVDKGIHDQWDGYRLSKTPPMAILSGNKEQLEISQSPWGHISESDLHNGLDDAAIQSQMTRMYNTYLQSPDLQGLQSFLRDSKIDTGQPDLIVPLDEWASKIGTYASGRPWVKPQAAGQQPGNSQPKKSVLENIEGEASGAGGKDGQVGQSKGGSTDDQIPKPIIAPPSKPGSEGRRPGRIPRARL